MFVWSIDTVQLGEIEGIHHGTYREKDVVVEQSRLLLRGRRSVQLHPLLGLFADSRAEVDGERIGVTGRSGGGAYSWWIAAVDDRIQGGRSGRGHHQSKKLMSSMAVSRGTAIACIMVNTYRWDFPDGRGAWSHLARC